MPGRTKRQTTRSRSTTGASSDFGPVHTSKTLSKRISARTRSTLPTSQDKDQDGPPTMGRFPFKIDVPGDLKLGSPTREQYTRIEREYLNSLSLRKRDKALLTQRMFDDVWDVLHNPKDSKISTPQFRFWVRKMFTLSYAHQNQDNLHCGSRTEEDIQPVILHEERPVALKEQIFDIVSFCHRMSGHGGRDRTMALVRSKYSWIPKELIAQFVKICPICVYKKTKDATLALSLQTPSDGSKPTNTKCDDSVHADQQDLKPSSSGEMSTNWNTPHADVSWNSVDATPQAHPTARRSMRDTLCLPPLVPHGGSSSSGSGQGYSLESYVYSPTEPQDSRTWLSSLTSAPGPNAEPNTLAPMRRVGSESDADPFRMPATRITLPPLMKALSEGGSDAPAPHVGIVPALAIPRYDGGMQRRDSSSSGGGYLLGPSGQLEGEVDEYAMDVDIDPVLLRDDGAGYLGKGKSRARAAGYDYDYDYDYALLSSTATDYVGDALPTSRPAVTATPIKLPHRTLIRLESGLSGSEETYDMPGPAKFIGGDIKSLASIKSLAASLSGGSVVGHRSFDEQDWEVRYCLEDSPP